MQYAARHGGSRAAHHRPAAIKTGSQACGCAFIGDSLPAQSDGRRSGSWFRCHGEAHRVADARRNRCAGGCRRRRRAGQARCGAAAAPCCKARFAVYDQESTTSRCLPETSLARLGSDVHPKGYQQFEAIGLPSRRRRQAAHRRRRGARARRRRPGRWRNSIAVFGDDDKEFVGTLSPTGLFTPALDGPNPKRKFSRNNYGDVWVVATAKNEKDKDGKPLVGQVLPGRDGSTVHSAGISRR